MLFLDISSIAKEGVRIMFGTALDLDRDELKVDFCDCNSAGSLTECVSDEVESDVDRKLAGAVAGALRDTGLSALRELDIEICQGVVVLWGRVPNYHQKQLAQVTAQNVTGVRGIANGVEVVCRCSAAGRLPA
jgi:osmotically-inducible protein OsmY